MKNERQQPVLSRFDHIRWRLNLVLSGLLLVGLINVAKADDLDDAFSSLVSGRAYLKGYPGTTDRAGLVNDFIGAGGFSPNRPMLSDAIQRVIQIRASELPAPATFPPRQPPRSVQAKVIAWESLEALLTGYLYAGNRDLLNATRIAYPGSSSSTDTRGLPRDEPAVFDGTSQKKITYARLYFLQGIKDVLDYIAEDTTGELRAGGGVYPTVPHYVTFLIA